GEDFRLNRCPGSVDHYNVFDYIEMFYNSKRRHGFNNQLSPLEFEKRHAMSLQGV
ncbi:IS3 family transposase, partial [Pseudomonas aeruginosa]|uniref:IS3 family transposase n=2 Tax=Pseudomonas aeruginosa TaxID=287 RepID=UPI00128C051E